MSNSRTPSATRRTVLRTALATGAAAAGGAAATPAAAQSGGGLAEWFSNTGNYDGVVDETGSGSVTVEVGSEANGGAFGFGPAAVRVDPGTTVTWEWTGNGGSHNVVAEGGAFETDLVGEAGHTFEYTFEEAGVYRYACTPHKAMGMKGAVVVGDAEVGGDGGDGGGETGDAGGEAGGTDTSTDTTATAESTNTTAAGAADGGSGGGAGEAPAYLLAGGGLAAALSPLVFGLVLLVLGDDFGPDPGSGDGYRADGGADAGRDRR
ncbi:halocyanin domain-containing protein [Halobaculum lipolyticum]|uniref:Halocyanin domain-containing protein n=1 Tax=Halobaculum lipolyticum TaxID=3032001 RepID=A0ABD5W5J3_9EURY